MWYNFFLGLGSNIGNREKNLANAIEMISKINETQVINTSSIYETDPVGYMDQEKFLNMALEIKTKLDPLNLLENFQEIETKLKRKREMRWGPRTIDIDILLWNKGKVNLPELEVPHKMMVERAFVLIPLKEIYSWGDYKIKFDELIDNCDDKYGVKLLNNLKRV